MVLPARIIAMADILPEQRNAMVSDCAIDPVRPFDQRQCSQLTFQMPLQMRGDQPAGLAAVRLRRRLRVLPVAVVERGHQVQHALRRGRSTRTGGSARTPLPPAATWNARCGPGAAQRAHSVSAGAQPAIPMARNR